MSLKSARLKSGKSVPDVMKFLGVSDSCVYAWEKGKRRPRPGKCLKLAQLYGCTVEDLFKEDLAS